MTGQMVLGSQVDMIGCSIYGGRTSGGGPLTNAVGREPSLPVIFEDLGDTWFEFGLAAPLAVNLLGILYAGASSSCTRRWIGAADRASLSTSPGYDSGADVGWFSDAGLKSRKYRKHDVLWLGDAPQTFQWWRLELSDVGNTANRLVIGKVIIAAAWQPAVNMTYGGGGGLIDPSRKPRTEQGQIQPLSRKPHRLHRFRLAFQDEDQMLGYADDLDEAVGATEPVLFLRESQPTTYRQKKALLGLQNEIGAVIDSDLDVYEKSYEIEELAA